MQHSRFDRVEIARQAYDLGARNSLVEVLTGISLPDLRRALGHHPSMSTKPSGMPFSLDTIVFHSRQTHLHASDYFNGVYHLLLRGIAPADALLQAFRLYLDRHPGQTLIDFNRAFLVVRGVTGLWSTSPPELTAARCERCRALSLAPLGSRRIAGDDCSFCKLCCLAPPAASLQHAPPPPSRRSARNRHFLVVRDALALGARRSVVMQMTGISRADLKHMFGACPTLHTNTGGMPRSVSKLLARTSLHLQASDFYNRLDALLQRRVPAHDAMLTAYRQFAALHAGQPLELTFDRAFVVAMSACGLWSDRPLALQATPCAACRARYLQYTQRPSWAAPLHCPYCHAPCPQEPDQEPPPARRDPPSSLAESVRGDRIADLEPSH